MQASDTTPWIFDVTASDFDQRVAKSDVPVLVDFWAPWCGPCRQIAPMLENLVERYAGRLHVAKVNVDEEATLAADLGVRSIPMLALFSGGKLVEQLVGVQPEKALVALIDRHTSQASDGHSPAVQAALSANDHEGALLLLQQALQKAPENDGIKVDIARSQLALGRLDDAEAVLAGLPVDIAASNEVSTLQHEIMLARGAQGLRDLTTLRKLVAEAPDDLRLKLELAHAGAAARDYSVALEQFLAVLQADRNFDDGAARKGLLAVFDILGSADERVQLYRRRMASLLN